MATASFLSARRFLRHAEIWRRNLRSSLSVTRGLREHGQRPDGRQYWAASSSYTNALTSCVRNSIRIAPSRHVTSRELVVGKTPPKRSIRNRRAAVDCTITLGSQRCMSGTTASRQLPWCGSSITVALSLCSSPTCFASKLAHPKVSMSPQRRTAPRCVCEYGDASTGFVRPTSAADRFLPSEVGRSTRMTSETSLSRSERISLGGQSTFHVLHPKWSLSPADTNSRETPCRFAVSINS